jgi:hypothetical protein
MSLLAAAVVVWGFGHTVGESLFHPVVPRPRMLWFHGAAFSGWILFFIFQSALVRTRNVKLHRLMGWFGVALGAVMVPLGWATAIVMVHFETYTLHETGRYAFFMVPSYDMIAFGTCFALAVVWRKKQNCIDGSSFSPPARSSLQLLPVSVPSFAVMAWATSA